MVAQGARLMGAGKLRQIIEIQQRVDTQDGLGEPVPSWKTVRTVRAHAEPMKGAEFFRSDVTLSDHPVTFTVRYDGDWVPSVTDRIVWRDVNYNIKSVADMDGRRREHEILAVRHA